MSESRPAPTLILITDGSVDTQSKIGFGAYLRTTDAHDLSESSDFPIEVKQFDDTSSTKLELQTLLWALDAIQPQGSRLLIYTDSQNIIGLPGRRARLEENAYCSQNGKIARNAQLYRDFFNAIDQLDCRFVKLKGHKPKAEKNELDKLFTLVDRASRNALRQKRLFRGD